MASAAPANSSAVSRKQEHRSSSARHERSNGLKRQHESAKPYKRSSNKRSKTSTMNGTHSSSSRSSKRAKPQPLQQQQQQQQPTVNNSNAAPNPPGTPSGAGILGRVSSWLSGLLTTNTLKPLNGDNNNVNANNNSAGYTEPVATPLRPILSRQESKHAEYGYSVFFCCCCCCFVAFLFA